MIKSARTRLNDTLRYIQSKINQDLARDIRNVIAGQESSIGSTISLGSRSDRNSDRSIILQNTSKRRALRALLLCQYAYYSKLWPKMLGNISQLESFDSLGSNWKRRSLSIWAGKSEADIQEALRAFIPTQDLPEYLASAAEKGQPVKPDNPLALTRDSATFNGSLISTCYEAVMTWMYMSGFVSIRWLLKYRASNHEAALTQAFGSGHVIWHKKPFGEKDSLEAIPRGYIVHIYPSDMYSWRGHWMVSLGGGQAAGVNNNEEKPSVPRLYCKSLTINKQFLDFGGGTAVIIDPARISPRF